MLNLDEHDAAIAAVAIAAIDTAIKRAHKASSVARRLHVITGRHRNKGRLAAIKRHAFKNVCEASGLPLERVHAHLDEMDPTQGFAGPVRWVCQRANNSGRHSCGGCK